MNTTINTLKILFTLLLLNQIASAQVQSDKFEDQINPDYLDKSVKPVQDFYEFSNGGWFKNNEIPPEYSRWGSWHEIRIRNEEILKTILEDASENSYSRGSIQQKLGDLYFTAMDTEAIEKAGITPLNGALSEIDAIQSKEDFQKVFAHLRSYRTGGLFGMYAGQDDKNSENVILNLYQGGLGLPERDYYFKDDERSKKLRDDYIQFMRKIFVLMGHDEISASAIADKLMDFEIRLAKSSMKRVDMREAEATYHLMTLDELKSLTPDFSWDIFFAELGLDNSKFTKGINVGQPEFFKDMDRLITDSDIDVLKNYLKWNLVRSSAEMLSSDFADASFDFYSKKIRGVEERRPRWKVSIDFVENAMGEPLGQIFVEKKFTPETKTKALEFVNNIKQSFGERIQSNEWMSDATKKEALRKLSTFNVKIGYPDVWKDYSGLEMDRTSFLNNMRNASAYNVKLNLSKIAKPVDRNEWGMFPQTVNAYYNSSKNEIVFPAGIMQPPFYDPNADDAINYGAIGAVIGHEMTHGFDDQGRKYDAEGNLKDWWTEEDAKEFEERADKLVQQYDGYVVMDSLHVNGRLTLGENIADLGGLIISYRAFQKVMEGKDKSPIDGFTPEQRFFLSYSQLWRVKSRPEVLRLLVNTDSHSPERFRVIGVISNMEEFMKAYNGKEGDPMVNSGDKRVVIW